MIAAFGARQDRPNLWLWISLSFATAIAVAVAILIKDGIAPDGIKAALRASARFSFLLFWGAYAGGLLRKLPLAPAQWLSRRRRECGLGFAVAHSVHLSLILWLFAISSTQPVSDFIIVRDGMGFGFMYLLVIFSFDFARRRLSPLAWRVGFNLGLEYIAYIFATDFILTRLHDPEELSIVYWPFTLMLVGTALLRWTAAAWWLVTRAWDARRFPDAA